MAPQERRVKANRLVPRRVQDALGHYQRYEGHHQQVRVERAELLEGLVALEGRRLAERYAQPERLCLERVGAAAGRVWRREDVDDLFAARVEHLERALGKGRLPDE